VLAVQPLSDALIAGRQMNPRLVMLFSELDGDSLREYFASIGPSSAPLDSQRREVYKIEPSPARPDQSDWSEMKPASGDKLPLMSLYQMRASHRREIRLVSGERSSRSCLHPLRLSSWSEVKWASSDGSRA
jgi:hypothetical protein